MTERDATVRVVVMGAAGRDFHDFNVVLRDDPRVRVVAFTAAQIPGIGGRRYPAALAGPRYPDGIPVVDESELEDLCRRESVDRVVFAYSDVTHETVMHAASRALATGADFELIGPRRSMLVSRRPVIAVCAARTGCGKSQISRFIAGWLGERGVRVAALRHPMPYGDLEAERVQRFATRADLDAGRCTAEEREEYEPYVDAGHVVFAGVDYAAVLERAESEADVVLWDGGNNDFAFLCPDLEIAVVDALRPDHVASHHPGETVVRRARVVIVNKVDAASTEAVQRTVDAVTAINPGARILRAASPAVLDDVDAVRGRRVLVIDDGPTLTHGDMPYGAGYVAAVQAPAGEIVDPRRFAPPEVAAVYARYPHIGPVLPAVGYSAAQLEGLRATVHASPADVVVSGTPCDIAALARLDRPVVRARYRYAPAGGDRLEDVLQGFLDERGGAARR